MFLFPRGRCFRPGQGRPRHCRSLPRVSCHSRPSPPPPHRPRLPQPLPLFISGSPRAFWRSCGCAGKLPGPPCPPLASKQLRPQDLRYPSYSRDPWRYPACCPRRLVGGGEGARKARSDTEARRELSWGQLKASHVLRSSAGKAKLQTCHM